MSSLFRKEAVEHQKDRLYGEVLLFQPLSLKILTVLILLIIAMIISLLTFGTYAKKATVQGFLMPDQGIAKVYMPQSAQFGTLSAIHVKEDQSVVAGQKLFTIITERSLEGGSDVDSLILIELEKKAIDLKNRLLTQKKSNEAELDQLQKQKTSLETQLIQATHSLTLQNDRLSSTKLRINNLKKLADQGYLSKAEYQKNLEDYLSHQQKQQELMHIELKTKTELTKLHSDIEQFPIVAINRIVDLEGQISDNKQRQLEYQNKRVTEIRAPISGVIDALSVKPGHFHIQQNQPLLSIIPPKSIMQGHLLIPTHAIGFIKPNQTVRVRYAAFPYQRYGVQSAKVLSISKNILHPNELTTLPLDIKEPVYLVIINLDKQNIMAYGKAIPLQSGMLFEADIVLEKQSLFRWILDPIYTLKGKL